MLRALVLGLGVVLIAAGLALAAAGKAGAALNCLIFGSLVVAGIVFERRIYKPEAEQPPGDAGWERTEERFVDEKTGKTITVYVRPETGERAYVVEGEAEPNA